MSTDSSDLTPDDADTETLSPVSAESVREAEKKPRSGRNLVHATAVGALLVAAAGVPLVWYPPAFVFVVAIAAMLGVRELTVVLRRQDADIPLSPVLLGAGGTVVLVWFTGAHAVLFGVTLTFLASALWLLAEHPRHYLRSIAGSVFVTAYVPMLASFVVLILASDAGAWGVVAFAVTVVCSDTGGYLVGSLFGKHRMSPRVSPGKTWEGFAGAIGLCAISGVAFFISVLDGQWWGGVIFGALVGGAAVLGDLVESAVKRDLGVKDMGKTLPAHGGFMDRFDSLLFAAPVAYGLLYVLVL